MIVQENVSLKAYTTLRIGGDARYFVEVTSVEELQEAARFSKDHNLAVFVLGGGSNILFPDEGWDGLVIKVAIKGRDVIEENETVTITVGAGEDWDAFVAYTVEQGWWGIENLSGIPGLVGATPIQNVGAYGVEVDQLIESVEVFNLDTGETSILDNASCQFSYRNSMFKTEAGRRLVVLRVTFVVSNERNAKLTYKDLQKHFADADHEPTLQEIRDAVLLIRAGKFPNLEETGTAGSFFKNPIISNEQYEELQQHYPEIPSYSVGDERTKVPLAWILQHVCDLKGYTKNNVGLFEKQPLILVTGEAATAVEVKNFIFFVKEKVFRKTGIKVEEEVRVVSQK